MKIAREVPTMKILCCIAIYYCCSVQLTAEACPYLQRRMAQRQRSLGGEASVNGSPRSSNRIEIIVGALHGAVIVIISQGSRKDDAEAVDTHRTTHEPVLVDRKLQGLPIDSETILTDDTVGDDDDGTTPPPSTCGDAPFCYGLLTPPSVEPFFLDWSTLVEIAETTPLETGYMEDTGNRTGQVNITIEFNNPGDSRAAGYTYLGQLLSHDVNLDEDSTLGQSVDPATIPNINTPMVDLETIYSFEGCIPNLENGTKFVLNDRDFERSSSGEALICDPRNDEHRIMSQMTVAFMTLHNMFVDEGLTFEQARDAVILEWQRIVLDDLLPNLVDTSVLSSVAAGDRLLFVGDAVEQKVMPVEFSTGAYRLMHSRARGRYRLNDQTDGSTIDAPLVRFFDVGLDEPNLIGGSPLPDQLVVDWDRMFIDPDQDLNITEVARILDPLYSPPQMRMPFDEAGVPASGGTDIDCEDVGCPIIADAPEVCPFDGGACEVRANLALLDLARGQTHSLPGGIAYAEYVATLDPSLDVLSFAEIRDGPFGLPPTYPADATDVPLLLYLGFEAVRDNNAEVLGNLGSRIVAETVYGLIEFSTPSVLLEQVNATTFVSRTSGTSTVTFLDLLDYIGWH